MACFYMEFPGGKRKALTLSYDDGVAQDQRLIEIMNQHGLKGTFNLSSGVYPPEGKEWRPGAYHRRLNKREATQLYSSSGQEVAIHVS